MKKLINFRFDENIILQIKAHAKDDGRSVSNFVEMVLKKYMINIRSNSDFKIPPK